MFSKIREILSSDKLKGVISLVAAVVMYYTPDNIDRIIELTLGSLGISVLLFTPKKK